MTNMDFFKTHVSFIFIQFNEYKPEFYFGNADFLFKFVFQFVLIYSKRRFSFNTQIITCLLVSSFNLVLLPIVVLTMQKLQSFICCIIIIIIQGLSGSIIIVSLYSIFSFFPSKYIILMMVGQGVAPIAGSILKYILLFSLPDQNKQFSIDLGSFIFFGITCLITIITLGTFIWAYKQPNFIYFLRSCGEFDLESKEDMRIKNRDDVEEKVKK
jgi:hypothetical protein